MADVLERVMAIFFENHGYLVHQGYQVPVKKPTKQRNRDGEIVHQQHMREVDLVAVRLATTPNPLDLPNALACEVKSFLGSQGVYYNHVFNYDSQNVNRYALVNDPVVRQQVLARLQDDFNVSFEIALIAGKFYPADVTKFFPNGPSRFVQHQSPGGSVYVIDAQPCINDVITLIKGHGRAYSSNELVQLIRVFGLMGKL